MSHLFQISYNPAPYYSDKIGQLEVQVRLAKSDDLTDKLTDQLLRERLAAFSSNARRIDNRIAIERAEYAEEAQGYYDCVAQLYELRLSLWPNGPGVYHPAIRDMCQQRNAHWNNALACRQTYQALDGSAVREKEKVRKAEEELVRFEAYMEDKRARRADTTGPEE